MFCGIETVIALLHLRENDHGVLSACNEFSEGDNGNCPSASASTYPVHYELATLDDVIIDTPMLYIYSVVILSTLVREGICVYVSRQEVKQTVTQLRALSANATREQHIARHDRDTLSVDGAQVGILEQAHEISFRSFLKGPDSGGLEAQIGLVVLRDLTYKTLEREFANQ